MKKHPLFIDRKKFKKMSDEEKIIFLDSLKEERLLSKQSAAWGLGVNYLSQIYFGLKDKRDMLKQYLVVEENENKVNELNEPEIVGGENSLKKKSGTSKSLSVEQESEEVMEQTMEVKLVRVDSDFALSMLGKLSQEYAGKVKNASLIEMNGLYNLDFSATL